MVFKPHLGPGEKDGLSGSVNSRIEICDLGYGSVNISRSGKSDVVGEVDIGNSISVSRNEHNHAVIGGTSKGGLWSNTSSAVIVVERLNSHTIG